MECSNNLQREFQLVNFILHYFFKSTLSQVNFILPTLHPRSRAINWVETEKLGVMMDIGSFSDLYDEPLLAIYRRSQKKIQTTLHRTKKCAPGYRTENSWFHCSFCFRIVQFFSNPFVSQKCSGSRHTGSLATRFQRIVEWCFQNFVEFELWPCRALASSLVVENCFSRDLLWVQIIKMYFTSCSE